MRIYLHIENNNFCIWVRRLIRLVVRFRKPLSEVYPVGADPTIYCLEQLTDYDQFERLCTDLMALEGYDGIEPLGGHKDKGRDALHVSKNNGRKTIFAYSVREDWLDKLNEDAAKIRTHEHECDELIFLCTAHYSATDRDSALKDIKAKFGFSLALYGLERLRVLLNKHARLISQHPHIFHPAFFASNVNGNDTAMRNLLVIDNVVKDETLSVWLANRLQIAGYQVWSATTSPVAGRSINDTIEKLVKLKAFRLLQIMSANSILDAEFNARRSYAFGVGDNLVLPLMTAGFDKNSLDHKSSKLEMVSLEDSWADGLTHLLAVLSDSGCPGFREATTRFSSSYIMIPDLVVQEPERVLSNRFAVTRIPAGINRYVSEQELSDRELGEAALRWAFHKVDQKRFLSFFAPPDDLRNQYGFKDKGGVAWDLVSEIDKTPVRKLLPELIRKSLMVHCIKKGLRFCTEFDGPYFPENLISGDRLYFIQPDGRKTFVSPVGERTLWRPLNPSIYKYALSPQFTVVSGYQNKYCAQLKTRIRFTDKEGNILPPRIAFSRRKHLCRSWFNHEWVHRMLAMIQFLSDQGNIIIGPTGGELVIAGSPIEWQVPVRINENLLENKEADHDEVNVRFQDEDDEIELGDASNGDQC